MPAPPPVTRRTALAAGFGVGGAVVLAACTSGSDTPAPPTPARPGADELARRSVAAREQSLLAMTDSTLPGPGAGQPRVRRAIDVAATAHAAHVAAMLDGLPSPSASSAAATSSSGSPAPSGHSTPPTPTPTTSVSALAQAQTEAAAAYQGLLGPVSGPVARLIASVAASDAALASALRGALR